MTNLNENSRVVALKEHEVRYEDVLCYLNRETLVKGGENHIKVSSGTKDKHTGIFRRVGTGSVGSVYLLIEEDEASPGYWWAVNEETKEKVLVPAAIF